jgi:hypothetical protein
LDIISLMALWGGSDFVPYAGISVTSIFAKIIRSYRLESQSRSDEHVHHPPDEEQGHDTRDDMSDPVASGFGFAEVKHAPMVALEYSFKISV